MHVRLHLLVLIGAALLPVSGTAIGAREAAVSPPAGSTSASTAQAVSGATPRAAPSTRTFRHWASGCRSRAIAHPLYFVLDGKSAPTARREAAFSVLQRCAQSGMVGAQNIVGSLYWMGGTLPDALVAHDPAKAELYFSNAAVHGQILDMYKMAYVELEGNHVDAAMIWALLYAHYEPLTARPSGENRRVLAELLVRIDRRFDQKHLPDAITHANAIIVKYDAAIRGYLGFLRSRSAHPAEWGSAQHRIQLPYLQLAHPAPGPPYAGITEFLIVYRPDGDAKTAWLLDAMPVAIAQRVRAAVTIPRIAAISRQTLRYDVRSMLYDEPRFGVDLRN